MITKPQKEIPEAQPERTGTKKAANREWTLMNANKNSRNYSSTFAAR